MVAVMSDIYMDILCLKFVLQHMCEHMRFPLPHIRFILVFNIKIVRFHLADFFFYRRVFTCTYLRLAPV